MRERDVSDPLREVTIDGRHASLSPLSKERADAARDAVSERCEMTDQPENQPKTDDSPSSGGEVVLDGTGYLVRPTAFPSHFQVMTSDGKLVGLIEFAGP